ncbi:transmembrane protein 244-like isoform X3 [Varanus komodoensis]|uniref:transmembrane protein 244-like isoform X3 n=1 Tax=Varanus komodoensis TaxID=61221 RepID=UPI001CF78C4C|nr:transmembrane protein 244-like isoform X3 [Varanus komodoensis]
MYLMGTSSPSPLHSFCQLPRYQVFWKQWPALIPEVIILHTLLGLLIFYTVYYMTGSICYGAFRINSFGMLIPFGFKTEPSFSNSSYLANVLAMEITFFISGLLFALLLRWWIWDYAITVTLAHVLLTCAVMKEFPLVWQWWLALAGGLFFMTCSGELLTYLACHDANYLSRSSFFERMLSLSSE